MFYGGRLFFEAIVAAYSRGKRQEGDPGYSVEEGYYDLGVPEIATEQLGIEEDWQGTALSPVLAFFPSTPRPR